MGISTISVNFRYSVTHPTHSATFVARGDLEYPIIGYNVIEEVIKSPDQMGEDSVESLGEILSSAFSEVEQASVIALVDLVQRTGVEEWQEQLKSARWADSGSSLSCRLRPP